VLVSNLSILDKKRRFILCLLAFYAVSAFATLRQFFATLVKSSFAVLARPHRTLSVFQRTKRRGRRLLRSAGCGYSAPIRGYFSHK
jgi:hypothetical protein